MHVLLVHQAFATLDEPGGTRHHELARALRRAGHQVTVLASAVSYMTGEPTVERGAGVEEDDLGVRIVRCPAYGGWHRSFVHRTMSFLTFMLSSFWLGLRVKSVDVVWGTSPPIFQGLTAWLLARLKRRPFIFEVRDLWPYFAIAVGVLRNPLLIRASRGLEGFLYRRADHVVVNSPGFLPHVRYRGARRVSLVANGVDTSMFDPAADGGSFRRQHDLEGSFLVVYAGAHGLSNDLTVALQASERIEDQGVQFVFLGDGKEKAALQQETEARGLTNVTFLPPLPKAQMAEALAAADACLASLKPIDAYKMTYPNKVFDYMAAGRPVLLAIDGVIREVVESAQAGLFVPPGDPAALAEAVRELAVDPERARAMGRRGRKYVERHFDRADQAQKFRTILEGELEKRGRT